MRSLISLFAATFAVLVVARPSHSSRLLPYGGPRPVVKIDGGSGCAGGVLLWTAWHIVSGEYGPPAGTWRLPPFGSGKFRVIGHDEKRDLAWGIAEGEGLPAPVPVAKSLPKSGERLWLVAVLPDGSPIRLPQYAFSADDEALYTDGTSFGGMSGACLLNEANELVAVNVGNNLPSGPPGLRRPLSRWAIVAGR